MTLDELGLGELVERLKKRAADERAIQANNEAVAAALLPQLEAFDRRDGSHNTFAVRLHLEHRNCAKHDGELAADWDQAADALTNLIAERDGLLERVDLWKATAGSEAEAMEEQKARALAAEAQLKTARELLASTNCPRPCNHRPDEFTAGECVGAGECGCYLLDQVSALSPSNGEGV